MFAILVGYLLIGARNLYWNRPYYFNSIDSVKTVECITVESISGVEMCKPKVGDRCWSNKLICTPYPNTNLDTIDSNGSWEKGFIIRK